MTWNLLYSFACILYPNLFIVPAKNENGKQDELTL